MSNRPIGGRRWREGRIDATAETPPQGLVNDVALFQAVETHAPKVPGMPIARSPFSPAGPLVMADVIVDLAVQRGLERA
jgi:hypothetical protein